MECMKLIDEDDLSKYKDKFVALYSFGGRVAAYGDDPANVIREAKAKGVEDPVLFYFVGDPFVFPNTGQSKYL
jgi:hypothetical protein